MSDWRLILRRILLGAVPLMAVLGVLAAIAVPNLVTAVGRSKQKVSTANLRILGSALAEYELVHKEFPSSRSITALVLLLHSEGLGQEVEPTDGWGHPMLYVPQGRHTTSGATSYYLVAAGRDGRFQHSRIEEYTRGAIFRFEDDLIFRNGEFFVYPSGV